MIEIKHAWNLAFGILLLTFGAASTARAQDVKIGIQTGIGYLPLQVMVNNKLLEKHARAQGLPNVRAELVSFANGNAMNDAMLSGAIQYASGGVSTFLVLWGKAEGSNEVRAVGALLSMPMYLNTRNPNIKTVKDFTDKDKIGVAGVKVSYQAMLLQMAAAKEFGDANFSKLDVLTVTVSNPNGVLALSNPNGEINTHFTPPPFAYLELRMPGVRTVLKSYDILGGPATLNQVWSTVKLRVDNPKLHAAFLAALRESTDVINSDKRMAAEVYIRMSGDKTPLEQIVEMLQDPEIRYSVVPNRVMVVADFMTKVGAVKKKITSWKDFYFPELHSLPGS